jgi:hypothetical protein
MLASKEKAKDLYRGISVAVELQQLVIDGHKVDLHPSTINLIKSIGIVAPKGLDNPKRCRCGGLLIAEPCVKCQIERMKNA